MDSIGFGVDISHHQENPPWDRIKAACDFVICRASYGGVLRDRKVVEHVGRARSLGIKTGLYQFYRPTQSVNDHFKMLKMVADVVQLGDGDIIPTIDVELDPFPQPTRVSLAWEPDLKELVDRVTKEWGGAMIYITQADFRLLGSPLWVLEHPLYVAHYTGAASPATPAGRKPHIWQHRVGPFDPTAPGGYIKTQPDIDHNRLIQPLPLIGAQHEIDPITDELRARVLGQVALTSAEIVYHQEASEGAVRSDRRCA